MYDLSVECMRLWVFRMLLSVNCFLQMLHWNGLSPVCTRKCLFQCSRSTNLLPHVSQGNGFSPVWVITCFPNLHFEENCFPHRRQMYLPAFSCLSTLHKKNCSRAITSKSSIYQIIVPASIDIRDSLAFLSSRVTV